MKNSETPIENAQTWLRGIALVMAVGTVGCSGAPPPGDASLDSLATRAVTGQPAPRPKPLVAVTLENGWTNAPYSTRDAGVYFDPGSGIVRFSGAVAGGTDPLIFTLAPEYRPSDVTYVPVDLCNGANGELIILTTGEVRVQGENFDSGTAQCFTSLEGVSYAATSAGFSPLTLVNGWDTAPDNYFAGYGMLGGVVRLTGVIASVPETSPTMFTLPVGFRPATNVYVPVDISNGNHGRLFIQPNGVVSVQAEGGDVANAYVMTSLDGAWFLPSASGVTPLALENGWTNAPYGTSAAGVEKIGGIVHFKGAIAHGSSAVAFTLPGGFAPSSEVYIPVDLCNATKGRLVVSPSGVVSVAAENGNFSNAQCFTSLDGASYTIAGFAP